MLSDAPMLRKSPCLTSSHLARSIRKPIKQPVPTQVRKSPATEKTCGTRPRGQTSRVHGADKGELEKKSAKSAETLGRFVVRAAKALR
jgi:hypothetical protein